MEMNKFLMIVLFLLVEAAFSASPSDYSKWADAVAQGPGSGTKPCPKAKNRILERKGRELPFDAVKDARLYAAFPSIFRDSEDSCSKIQNHRLLESYTLLKCINERKTDTQAIIVYDKVNMNVVVSFRGSTTAHDWVITNANTHPKPIDNKWPCTIFNPKNRCVHGGFLKAANSVYQTIKNELKPFIQNGTEIYITGYSLGGALATITTYKLAKDFGKHLSLLNMFVYGCPPVGNKAFVDKFRSFSINSYDITQIGDIVSYYRCLIPAHLKFWSRFIRPTFGGYYLPELGGHSIRQYRDQLRSIQTKEKYKKAYGLQQASQSSILDHYLAGANDDYLTAVENEVNEIVSSNEYYNDDAEDAGPDFETENEIISNEFVPEDMMEKNYEFY